MSDLEQRANQLFAAARELPPIDRRMLDRVAVRLDAKPRRLSLLPLAAALALAVMVSYARAPREESLAEAPALLPRPKFESKRLLRPAPKLAAPRARPRFRSVVVAQPMVVEQPIPERAMVPAPELVPERKQYLPRAIADFQSEDDDAELRSYIQWILVEPDAMVCR